MGKEAKDGGGHVNVDASQERHGLWAWKRELIRAFFVLVLTALIGNFVVQFRDQRDGQDQRLLMDAAWTVACVAAAADLVVGWVMRRRAAP